LMLVAKLGVVGVVAAVAPPGSVGISWSHKARGYTRTSRTARLVHNSTREIFVIATAALVKGHMLRTFVPPIDARSRHRELAVHV
jgi:hypothetical protein